MNRLYKTHWWLISICVCVCSVGGNVSKMIKRLSAVDGVNYFPCERFCVCILYTCYRFSETWQMTPSSYQQTRHNRARASSVYRSIKLIPLSVFQLLALSQLCSSLFAAVFIFSPHLSLITHESNWAYTPLYIKYGKLMNWGICQRISSSHIW